MNETSLLIHELYQKVRLLTKEVNERLLPHDLYNSQWSILFCLQQFGPMTQTEIWRYLNIEAPTVTRTLTRLEKGGWISREIGADKREKVVTLTEKAKHTLPAVEQTIEQFEQDMTSGLSQADQECLLHLLRKLGVSNCSTRKEHHHE